MPRWPEKKQAEDNKDVQDLKVEQPFRLWREIKLFRQVEGNPLVIYGLDTIGNNGDIVKGLGTSTGELVGGGQIFKFLLTEKNLTIAKSYLSGNSYVLIEPDPGLRVEA